MGFVRASSASFAAEFGISDELSELILTAIHYLPISKALRNIALDPLAIVELAS
jgi:predicted fused transcriptional regulator/phosphomethylpyrimidine kinase